MKRPSRPARTLFRRSCWIGTLAPILLALVGCGGETIRPVNTSGDPKQISDLVESLNEFSTDAKRTIRLFATGKMPQGADFKKYARYTYFPTHEADQQGDSATMQVSLREEKTSEDAGTVAWSFAKEAGAWKIVAAPLP